MQKIASWNLNFTSLVLPNNFYKANFFPRLFLSMHIQVDQAVLELNREILLLGAKEKMVRAYFKYMIDLAEIFGATSRLQAQKELSESIFFEIQLAKVR